MTIIEIVILGLVLAVLCVAGVVVAADRVLHRRGLSLVDSVRGRGRVRRVKIRRGRDGRGYARFVAPKRP